MAEQTLSVARANDRIVLQFFETAQKLFQFDQSKIWISGIDQTINLSSPEFQKIKAAGKYSVRQANITKQNSVISYVRDRFQDRIATPDSITFNNEGAFNIEAAINITTLITDTFYGSSLGALPLLGDPKAFQAVIQSHQEMISRIETSLISLAEEFSKERIKLQHEQDKFLKEKQSEFDDKEARIRESYTEKEARLDQRLKELDDRDNMHARRGLHASLQNRIKGYAERFSLTPQTQRLRLPIHATVWLALATTVTGVIYYSLALRAGGMDYVVIAKSSLLTVAAFALLAWYMRWMNRWFDQHAEAEFNLKQFELDIDRASWVVETSMEWKSSQHGIIPTHLLQSISRNLFISKEMRQDENIHPADYLASAIFGSAAKAKIKVGENEIELDRKSMKELEKDK